MSLEHAVIEALKKHKGILSTVESCTGGQISHTLTNVSGASTVFWGASVTYDNSAKVNLGVSPQTLEKYGAVSEQTARELAECGLLRLTQSLVHPNSHSSLSSDSDLISLATTGIAGPSGGTEQKPIGLCYVGLARRNHPTKVFKILAESTQTRQVLKQEFTLRALGFLLNELNQPSG